MLPISRLCALLLVGVTLFFVAAETFGAPADVSTVQTAELKAAPDETGGRVFRNQKPDPKHEKLEKIADVPKKFAFAAGGFVIAVIWNVLLVVGLILAILVVIYYIRNRRSGDERGVATLAKAFDQAVAKVRAKRRELQAQVNVLAKREAVVSKPKKKTTKPRKRVTRAKKTS